MCFIRKNNQKNMPVEGSPASENPEIQEPIGETFDPVQVYQDEAVKNKRKKTIRIILISLLIIIAVAVLFSISYYQRLKTNTAELFTTAKPSPSAAPSPKEDSDSGEELVFNTLSTDPFEGDASVSKSSVDLSGMDNIVNILLMGIDYAEERETWRGKDGLSAAHSDVVIVLAINFDKNTASLISIPRDTYTVVPGVSGVYKLNGSFNCGGGLLAEDDSGFKKVCETASYLLGGIPVDYYYAVTMPAVKQLVDAIGGVDYHLEVSFTMQGRSYHAGRRHMDGQAVLDYLRVRKESSGLEPEQTGDAHRVQRQRKMLVAIFEQLKKKGLMLNIANILNSFEGQLYTNCSMEQTASLALYGYNMPSENITMQSMVGSGGNLYSWNFSFLKQDKRVQLIKKIYGVDVPRIEEITQSYANKFAQIKVANQYISTCRPLSEHVEKVITENPDKYGGSHSNIYQKYLDMLDNCISIRETGTANQIRVACSKLKAAALKCASSFDYRGIMTWSVPILADLNGVYVDFR